MNNKSYQTENNSHEKTSETPKMKGKTVTSEKLKEIMSDIDGQPGWRSNANKACAYYDGDQLTAAVKATLDERGQPPTVHNLCAPAVDGVLGQEAKTRTDIVVKADDADEEMEIMAEAINSHFSDVARISRLDRARSDAYASMIKAGLGFVEVYRSLDLLGNKYKINNVARDEVYWDWHSRQLDFSDARWMMRCRWIDADELIAMVPKKKEIIENAIKSWSTFIDVETIKGVDAALLSAYEEYQGWSREESEWLSVGRDRVRLQIIYYRSMERVQVISLNDGRVIEYDETDPRHQAVLDAKRAKIDWANVSHITESWYAGPHLLITRPCKAPRGQFPIVPFFGYRKDSSGEPYGLIARAIPAQDEVNFRRIKLTWLLQAKRVVMDQDATTMSNTRVMEEVERPDGMIVLNPERRNQKSVADSFQVQSDFNIASQQFDVMRDSMQQIQDTMGIYGAFLGQQTNASSGVAIANIVEQGATTLAEINDNYRFGTQLVGELLLGYIMEDLQQTENFAVNVVNEDMGKRKKVILNERNEDGLMNNDLARLRTHITLAPIQQTSAYKAQLSERMMQVTAMLPAEMQVVVLDLVLELSDVPNKAEYLKRIRSSMNIKKDEEDMTDEDNQAAEEEQKKQQQQEEMMMRDAVAKITKLEAEAQLVQAKAQSEISGLDSQGVDDAKTKVETAEIMANMEIAQKEISLKFEELKVKLRDNINSQIDGIDDK